MLTDSACNFTTHLPIVMVSEKAIFKSYIHYIEWHYILIFISLPFLDLFFIMLTPSPDPAVGPGFCAEVGDVLHSKPL